MRIRVSSKMSLEFDFIIYLAMNLIIIKRKQADQLNFSLTVIWQHFVLVGIGRCRVLREVDLKHPPFLPIEIVEEEQ